MGIGLAEVGDAGTNVSLDRRDMVGDLDWMGRIEWMERIE